MEESKTHLSNVLVVGVLYRIVNIKKPIVDLVSIPFVLQVVSLFEGLVLSLEPV